MAKTPASLSQWLQASDFVLLMEVNSRPMRKHLSKDYAPRETKWRATSLQAIGGSSIHAGRQMPKCTPAARALKSNMVTGFQSCIRTSQHQFAALDHIHMTLSYRLALRLLILSPMLSGAQSIGQTRQLEEQGNAETQDGLGDNLCFGRGAVPGHHRSSKVV